MGVASGSQNPGVPFFAWSLDKVNLIRYSGRAIPGDTKRCVVLIQSMSDFYFKSYSMFQRHHEKKKL